VPITLQCRFLTQSGHPKAPQSANSPLEYRTALAWPGSRYWLIEQIAVFCMPTADLTERRGSLG
jgi:hypothetical protein